MLFTDVGFERNHSQLARFSAKFVAILLLSALTTPSADNALQHFGFAADFLPQGRE